MKRISLNVNFGHSCNSHMKPGMIAACKIIASLRMGDENFWVPNSHSYKYPQLIGVFACSDFSRPKCITVTKSAKLCKSVAEKLDPKKHLSFLVAICDQKHANRIPQSKVVV